MRDRLTAHRTERVQTYQLHDQTNARADHGVNCLPALARPTQKL